MKIVVVGGLPYKYDLFQICAAENLFPKSMLLWKRDLPNEKFLQSILSKKRCPFEQLFLEKRLSLLEKAFLNECLFRTYFLREYIISGHRCKDRPFREKEAAQWKIPSKHPILEKVSFRAIFHKKGSFFLEKAFLNGCLFRTYFLRERERGHFQPPFWVKYIF